MAVQRKKTNQFTKEYPFGKPEEAHLLKVLLAIAFVIIGTCAIVTMIATDPDELPLKCDGPTSLIYFGGCVTVSK